MARGVALVQKTKQRHCDEVRDTQDAGGAFSNRGLDSRHTGMLYGRIRCRMHTMLERNFIAALFGTFEDG